MSIIDQYFSTLGLTWGVLLILLVGIVIFLLVAIVLEIRTRRAFPERKESEDDDGGLFDFDDGEDEDSAADDK